jgi:hypothetical protein
MDVDPNYGILPRPMSVGHNNTATETNANCNNSNENFQHEQRKGTFGNIWRKNEWKYIITGIPYDVQLTKPDNETQFGFKIGTIENQTHHYISTVPIN